MTRGLTRSDAQFTTKEEDRGAEVVHQSYGDVDPGQGDEEQEGSKKDNMEL